MKVAIPYGKDEAEFEVPEQNLMGVFLPKSAPGVSNELKAVRESLLNPIGAKPLPEIAKGKSSVVIIASDMTRPTKDHIMVPAILDVLIQSGVKERGIKVIIGRGQHREMTEDEVERKLGKEVLDRVSVVQHSPDTNLADLGVSSRGNRILVNRDVAKADLRISTGNIVPHRYAGFGGGAKSILPAVAGRETIYRNHLYVVEGKSGPGIVEGNPIRMEMDEAAEMAGLDFIVNTVMNSEGRVVKVFSGDFKSAHGEGVKFARDLFGVRLPSRAEIVVSSGSPMDINFYQASKALEMGDSVVADGGTFVVASPCYDGIGDEDLYTFLRLDSSEILNQMKKPKPGMNLVSAVIAYLMARTRERIGVVWVSDGLEREQVEAMGFKKARSIQEAVNESIARKKDAKIAVFPKGPITLALL
jgi:nickel-dependent lactate racemase